MQNKLTKFAGVHNVSLRTTVPHLVKLCKSIFPDSAICQEMSSLTAGRLYYGMKEGLGKTEVRITVKDLLEAPFSLQMDGGLKGGKHRLNFIVRYYSMDTGKCVEKFIIAKTKIHETAAVVANCVAQGLVLKLHLMLPHVTLVVTSFMNSITPPKFHFTQPFQML